MSDLLNSASLVMIPSGYKEDVVYSQIPTDGSGDLSFTRASNGTRINSAGLVEVCPWNLVENSEDFSNAAWNKNNTVSSAPVVTANDTTAPNGTTTADKIVFSNGVGGPINGVYQYFTQFEGARTASVWLKSASGTPTIYLTTQDDATGGNYTTCVLSTEWQRFEVTYTTSAISFQSLLIGYYPGAGSPSGPSGSLTIYAWGAQVNIGSTAKPYFPTTDRLNVPRLTYQNGGGGCPSLLLEKQSTNLAIYSQQFNSGYTTYNGTITDNFATAPDGTQTAAKVELVQFNSATLRQTNGGLTNGQPYTLSLYIKQGSGVTAFLDISDTASTVNITPTNEWVRYSYTANWNTTLNFLDIELRGTNGSYCYIWGCQLEAGTYPTSYIPTTSSSATRVADACFKTGISSLIPTEGTLFCDFTINGFGAFTNICGLDNIGTDNATVRFWSGIGAPGMTVAGVYAQIFYAGNVLAQLISTTPNERIKGAIRYKSGDVAVYVNGVQIFAGTSTFTPVSLNQLTFTRLWGNPEFANTTNIKEAVIFPVLTNAELASLTTI